MYEETESVNKEIQANEEQSSYAAKEYVPVMKILS